jgi:hypothetical protein
MRGTLFNSIQAQMKTALIIIFFWFAGISSKGQSNCYKTWSFVIEGEAMFSNGNTLFTPTIKAGYWRPQEAPFSVLVGLSLLNRRDTIYGSYYGGSKFKIEESNELMPLIEVGFKLLETDDFIHRIYATYLKRELQFGYQFGKIFDTNGLVSFKISSGIKTQSIGISISGAY